MKKFTVKRNVIKVLIAFTLVIGYNVSKVSAQTEIQVGEVYDFSQAPSSTVEYEVDISSPGEITIYIDDWFSTYNWSLDYDRIYIYNDEGDPVAISVFGSESDPFLFHMFSGNEGLVFNLGQAGTYTIEIHSGQHTYADWGEADSQNYSLSVTAIYCEDVYEINDTISMATPIAINSTIYAYQWREINTSAIWGDEDCYSFTIDAPGKLTIELVDWVAVYNWGLDFDRLYVYNAMGESIGFTDGYDFYRWMMGGGTESSPVVIEMNLAHAGTYYLKFHAGAATSTTPYYFTTSFIAVDDVFEPNDDFETAKLISTADVWHQAYEWRSLDNTMNVYGDEDYYYFIAADAGQYSITLDGWIPIYNWGTDYDRLFIFDSDGNSVGASPFAWMMGTDPIYFDVPSAGKYYLQLHCGGTYSIDGYQFQLSGSILTGDKENLPDSNFEIYPSPFSQKITVSFNNSLYSSAIVNLYNVSGELIIKADATYKKTFEMKTADLETGVYIIEIISDDQIFRKKVLKAN